MPQGLPVPNLGVKVIVPGGAGQSTGTLIKSLWSPSLILIAGAAAGYITLPPASKGLWFYIKNVTTNQLGLLYVYPAAGNAINGLAANAFLQMGPQTSCMIAADGSGRWHTVPAIPS